MWKRESKIAGLSVITFAVFILFGEMQVRGAAGWATSETTDITIDGQKKQVYLWGNAENWDTGEVPDDKTPAVINRAEGERAVVNNGGRTEKLVVGAGNGNTGELEITGTGKVAVTMYITRGGTVNERNGLSYRQPVV